MKCLRCGGFVVYEEYYNLLEYAWGLKCLICGEIIDPIIMENRKLISMDQMMLPLKVKRPKTVLQP